MSHKLLKHLIEEIVRASPDYLRKENVRSNIQNVITNMIENGDIQNEADLENFFSSAAMSLSALKMVPFSVYKNMTK